MMCFVHTQMVLLLVPPTAQMDCQSSHGKRIQERSHPEATRKARSAPVPTQPDAARAPEAKIL